MSVTKTKWSPIVSDEEKEKIEYHLDKISDLCMKKIRDFEKIGLHTGLSGISVFLFHYSKYARSRKHEEAAIYCLNKVIQCVSSSNQLPNFCSGIAGACCGLMYLDQKKLVEVDDGFLDEVDEYLRSALHVFVENEDSDFLHGYSGILFYFVERLNYKQNDLIHEAIDYVVTHLLNIAIHSEAGAAWKFNSSKYSKLVGHNFGLAHGIPGIILLLLKAPHVKDEIKETIFEAFRYINNLKSSSSGNSLFPNFITEDGVRSGNSRLAWCYGDLGVGLSFYQIGKTFESELVEDEAIRIFNHAGTRVGLSENGIVDACFCHGTSGISHIFNRMFHNTGEESFKKIAHHWNQQTILMLEGEHGYQTWFGSEGWVDQYCILEGISGVGLSLLAAIDHVEPDWDKFFLIS